MKKLKSPERKAERRLRDEHEAAAVARVIVAAVELVGWAPPKPNPGTRHAMIHWSVIHELRDALDAAGYEWRPWEMEARP